MPNAVIQQITLPSGTTYDLQDSRVDSIVSQSTRWVGVTTTALSDGSSATTIIIGGESHNVLEGDIASYNNMEFIFNGTIWQEFGSTGSLKALAFKDSVAVSTDVPSSFTTTFTGKSGSVSVTGTSAGSVSETKSNVEIKTKVSGTNAYTPAGTNASSSVSASGTVTPTGDIKFGPSGSQTTNAYTPAGSVAAPTISVATAGVLPSITDTTPADTTTPHPVKYSVNNKVLTISMGDFSAGSFPTYSASAPAFTGTEVAVAFAGGSDAVSVTGTADAQTFTGTAAYLETANEVLTAASFSGESVTSTGTFTPEAQSVSTTVAGTTATSGTVTYSPANP